MSSLRKRKTNPLVSAFVVLVAVAVFALPQGVCLRTILGDDDCCSTPILAAMASSTGADSCCQTSRNDGGQKGDAHSDSSDSDGGCLWTPTDPYVLTSGHGMPDVAALEPVTCDWIRTMEIQLARADSPMDFLDKEFASPALRRGSSILRI